MPAMSVLGPGGKLGMYSSTEVGEGSNWSASLDGCGGGGGRGGGEEEVLMMTRRCDGTEGR